MANLNGKVAVVTGASKGIGAAVALRLAADGAAVVVNYSRSAEQAQQVVARIKEKGGKAVAVQADVSDPAQVKTLFAKAVETFGTVDVLINNAGVFEFRPLDQIDVEHIDRQFKLNVTGLIFASQEAARIFGDRGGRIVNISSVVAQTPPAGGSVYSATKGAVDTITRALAAELGSRKILVNAVAPGATASEGFHEMEGSGDLTEYAKSRTPLARLGEPSDIADAVAFFASDDARWVTGEVIQVSGGLRL